MHSLRRTAARKLHLPGRSAGSLPEQEAEEEAAEGEYHVRVQVVELRELKVEGDTMPDPLVQVVRRGGGQGWGLRVGQVCLGQRQHTIAKKQTTHGLYHKHMTFELGKLKTQDVMEGEVLFQVIDGRALSLHKVLAVVCGQAACTACKMLAFTCSMMG